MQLIEKDKRVYVFDDDSDLYLLGKLPMKFSRVFVSDCYFGKDKVVGRKGTLGLHLVLNRNRDASYAGVYTDPRTISDFMDGLDLIVPEDAILNSLEGCFKGDLLVGIAR